MEYVNGGLTAAQALTEASRCLHCYGAPCKNGCPAGIDVPKFIRRLATDDVDGAAEVIRTENPFGAVCAAVCPSEVLCEKECSSCGLGGAVRIAKLQAYVLGAGSAPAAKRAGANGKKVAVVGGGPGGLTAAHYLALAGCDVTVFEKSGRLGGVPVSQIPAYRLGGEAVEADLAAIAGPAVCIEAKAVGAAEADAILEAFDAVYIAAGLGPKTKAIPMGAPGCLFAEDFLEHCKAGRVSAKDLGNAVVVLGGGNTAMDAASVAKALGAPEVTVLYRRTQGEMPAWNREYMHAVSLGVQFAWQQQALDVIAENGRAAWLRVAPTVPRGKDGQGRDNMEADSARMREMRVTAVISALGRSEDPALCEAFGLQTNQRGHIAVDDGLRTSHPKVFAGGDFVNGGATVVQAVADGKKAAASILALWEG